MTTNHTKVFSQADREAAERLFQEIKNLSPGSPGVTRPSYSVIETRATYEISRFAEYAGLDMKDDAAENLHIIDGEFDEYEGIKRPSNAVWIGSHVDSVPNGGNYDGLAGIVAGLLVLQKIRERRLAGHPAKRPVRVVALRGEESAWFGVPHIGAKALLGKLLPADLDRCDAGGVSLRDRMHESGADLDMICYGVPLVSPSEIAGFWELHIEQGPVLVAKNAPIGVVSNIRGNMRAPRARIKGQAGHSGTTPRALRHDAVFAFAELISRLDAEWDRTVLQGHDLVVTCGQVKTNEPCNLTRIPDDVEFCLEWRSQSLDELLRFSGVINTASKWIAQTRGVEFDFGDIVTTMPSQLDDAMAMRAVSGCAALTDTSVLMPSGAGHDAAVFSQASISTGMIFVRNANGSHNPDEAMDMGDFMLGVELLYQMVTA